MATVLHYHGATDIGNKRTNNEDTFICQQLWDERHLLVAAIDGMGGYEGGEVAAALARDTIISYLGSHTTGNRMDLLCEAVTEANNVIFHERQLNEERKNMGCVLTAGLFDLEENILNVAHVGDSRLYRFANSRLEKLTHDHSPVGEREDSGHLSEAQAMAHPRRNEVNRCVGMAEHAIGDEQFLEAIMFPLSANQTYLFCTDGLSDMLSAAAIMQKLIGKDSVQQKVQKLIDAANNNGGKDNITAIIVQTTNEDNHNSSIASDNQESDESSDRQDNPETDPESSDTSQASNTPNGFDLSGFQTAPKKVKPEQGLNILRGFVGFVIVSIAFVLGCTTLLSRQQHIFDEYDALQQQGAAMCLTAVQDAQPLKELLLKDGYIEDEQDAECISKWITERIADATPLPNLGALNRPAFGIPLEHAASAGGKGLKERVEAALLRVHVTPTVQQIYNGQLTLEQANATAHNDILATDSTAYSTSTKPVTISVIKRSEAQGLDKVKARLHGDDSAPQANVLVALMRHTIDYKYKSGNKAVIIDSTATETVAAYALTDASGKATFDVPTGWFYSVLPVKPGCQYGRARGTSDAAHDAPAKYQFGQREHKITPFSNSTYIRLKDNKALVVRTPVAYVEAVHAAMLTFLAIWWVAFFYLGLMDKYAGRRSDRLLPLLLMMLTGFCIVMMFAVVDPLADNLLGDAMVSGTLWGVVAMCIASSFNVVGMIRYHRWLQWGGMGLALMFVLLLRLFGTGPEGSDARVNLVFFQPSEVSKYLIVLAFAAFFASPYGAQRIQAFSQHAYRRNLTLQLRTMAAITFTLLLLLALYLGLISDMGPALVLAVTFILLYSIARQDLPHLLFGVLSFIAMIVGGQYYLGQSTQVMMLCAAAWFAIWILGWWLAKRVIYESAIMLNLLLSAFTLGGAILEAMHVSGAQRLLNRIEMAGEGVWNNTVPGGDQVVQGIWALATGGLTGQGLGQGNANLIPAFHTDMIFISIGEVLGWVALVVIVLGMTAIIHHGLMLARRTAHPFAFFLLSGIALVTGVQFVVIVAGSIGLIPLTGVAVPFLSFGKSSLIVNLAFFGLAIGASRFRPTEAQRQDIRSYNSSVAGGSLSFLSVAGILLAVLWHYQVAARDEVLIRPAYITTLNGERIAEYNPRIRLLMRRLEAGNIYDRNGMLIATSSPQQVLDNIASYTALGMEQSRIEAEAHRRQTRYYPLGEHLFFMLGDANTQTLWNINDSDPYGYLAESRHEGDLRGFDIHAHDEQQHTLYDTLTTDRHRLSPFMPPTSMSRRVCRRDYTHLLPMLKEGLNGPLVKQHNESRSQRDLRLTVDATLQVRMQERLAAQLPTVLRRLSARGMSKVRASVVVLDAQQGDLLCSAMYPLPNQDTIVSRFNDRKFSYKEQPNEAAYTERDLGLTYATAPGSTAKVVSAMAALRNNPNNAQRSFWIRADDTVEPPGVEPIGFVDMETAIVKSSNCYFIRIVHGDTIRGNRPKAEPRTVPERVLYNDLAEIYMAAGLSVSTPATMTPYVFSQDELSPSDKESFVAQMNTMGQNAVREYRLYWKRHDRVPRNARAGTRFKKMNMFETAMAWGQGNLTASPLAMARIASTVINGGQLTPTRYVLGTGSGSDYQPAPVAEPIRIFSAMSAETLAGFMRKETNKHKGKNNGTRYPNLVGLDSIGGKTGTPERGAVKMNDGWYICFVHSAHTGSDLGIAIRLERINDLTSGQAVQAVSDIVVPVLNETGYRLE